MLPKELNEKFNEFFGAMEGNKYLGKKTTLLIFIAAAISGGCDR